MVISVDFDGTIVEHAYPKIGKEIPFAFDTLKRLQNDGHLLILFSVREGELLDEAVEYCKKKGVEFYAVNSSDPESEDSRRTTRKVNADVFIDDHNLGGLPDWGIIYQMIKSGSPLQPYQGLDEQHIKNKKNKGLLSRLFS